MIINGLEQPDQDLLELVMLFRLSEHRVDEGQLVESRLPGDEVELIGQVLGCSKGNLVIEQSSPCQG